MYSAVVMKEHTVARPWPQVSSREWEPDALIAESDQLAEFPVENPFDFKFFSEKSKIFLEEKNESWNSEMFQKLHLRGKGTDPGQNRLPEGRVEEDRRYKQSKGPEISNAWMGASFILQKYAKGNERCRSYSTLSNGAMCTVDEDHPNAHRASAAADQEAGLTIAERPEHHQGRAPYSHVHEGQTFASIWHDCLPKLWKHSPQGTLQGFSQPLGFKPLTLALLLPGVRRRPISKPGVLSDAMNDELSGLLHGVISGSVTWIPPCALFIRFLYVIKRMPPEQSVQEYRMMSAFAALGPVLGSDLRASISWWLLINAVSLVSLVQYAQACSPRFHKSQWLVGVLIAGGIGLDCVLCYLSAPSQGVDSKLFGQLLGPSFWLVLVILDVISKRRTWLRDRLQHIVNTLV